MDEINKIPSSQYLPLYADWQWHLPLTHVPPFLHSTSQQVSVVKYSIAQDVMRHKAEFVFPLHTFTDRHRSK